MTAWLLGASLLTFGICISLPFILPRDKPVENRPFVVSMTTIPERLRSDYFKKVVYNLLAQKPDAIHLNIPEVYKRTGEIYEIPEWVANEAKIIVNRCEDVGPLTKVWGALPVLDDDTLVMIADDDQMYQPWCISKIKNSFAKQPRGVHCFNVFQEERWMARGSRFRFAKTMPAGYAGFAALAKDLKQLSHLPRFPECFPIDDHWLGWAFAELRIPVKHISEAKGAFFSLQDNPNVKGRHPPWYELRLQTNRRLVQRYCGDAIEEYWKNISQDGKNNASRAVENVRSASDLRVAALTSSSQRALDA